MAEIDIAPQFGAELKVGWSTRRYGDHETTGHSGLTLWC